MPGLTRRRFGLLAAGIGLATQVSCTSVRDGDRLRVAFYGDTDVNRGIADALRYLRRALSVASSAEPGGFQSYYDKLATRFAGGAAPDVVMTDFTHLAGYAQRGALLDMADHVPDPIDPRAGRQGVLDGGRNGKRLYGISIGTHTQTLVVNEKILRRFGLPIPSDDLTWDDYVELSAEIGRASEGAVHGSVDGGGRDLALDVWLRQRGADLFDHQGGLGFEQDQLYEWFDFWERLRQRGAVAPIEVTADTTVDPLVAGRVAMDLKFTNITGLQDQIDGRLRLLPIPAATVTDEPAAHQYIKPTNMFSVNAATREPEQAVELAAAFLTEPEVGERLGVSLGSPPNAEVFERYRRNATGVEKRILEFDDMVQRRASGSYPPTRPLGADQLLTATGALLGQLNLGVGYGQLTPAEAAEDFFRRSGSFLLEAR